MKTVIIDLDGTLADNNHRKHLLPDFDAFNLACVDDTLVQPVAVLARILWQTNFDIHIFSGRGEIAERQTREWLSRNFIRYNRLTMRPAGDYTADHELKLRWAKEFGYTPDNVAFILDDRNSVVQMWRENGFTCFQVAEGNF